MLSETGTSLRGSTKQADSILPKVFEETQQRKKKMQRSQRPVVASVLFVLVVMAIIYHSKKMSSVTEEKGSLLTGAVTDNVVVPISEAPLAVSEAPQVQVKRKAWSSFCDMNEDKSATECGYLHWLTKQGKPQSTYPGYNFGEIRECSPPDNANISEFRAHIYQMLFPLDRCSSWSGLELGALHQSANIPPQCNPGRKFVDKWPTAKLREFYPELGGYTLVEPDILDDAATLATIPDASVDYVIASHLLEHMQDPLDAVVCWLRVLKPGGRLIMMVPNKCNCFDRERIVTSWDHFASENGNPAELAKNLNEHYREWAISYTHLGDKWKDPNNVPIVGEFDETLARLIREGYYTHGGWHTHTWDSGSWSEFIHNINGHFKGKLGSAWKTVDVKSSFSYGLDLVAVLEKR